MSSHSQTQKLISKIGLAVILLFVAFFSQVDVDAQNKKIPTKLNLYDLNPDTMRHGLLHRIVQPIKFKLYRDSTEIRRVYNYLSNLVETGKLKIDESNVNLIMRQLDTLFSQNKITAKQIDDFIKSAKLDSITNKSVVDNIRAKMGTTFDSITTQMSAVIQENTINNNQDKRELQNKINTTNKAIKSVKYSRASNLASIDSVIIKDTILYYKKSLNPKIKVIGWHSAQMKDEYKRYNYFYLSAINLDSYELSSNGKSKNPEDIREFQKPGGVIEFAHSRGCDVYINISSKSTSDIKSFLGKSDAQKMFMNELNELINKDKLTGVNINFSDIPDSKRFVEFISELNKDLKSKNKDILLTISIPALTDNSGQKKISAYSFDELNSLVDFFQVSTDAMLPQKTRLAQAESPLYKSDKYGNRSIEETIAYYSNSVIPISKLITTVTYSGNEWKVKDFTGTIDAQTPTSLKYNEIRKIYSDAQNNDLNIFEDFDPDQASAFLNVIDPKTNTKQQIWYDDFRSLYKKYNWMLQNGLGGVAIKGLGNDDWSPELWDVLGATLIEIDSIPAGKRPLKTNVTFGLYWKIFLEDFQWAMDTKLSYHDPVNDTKLCDCGYDKNIVEHLKDSPILWQTFQDYNMDNVNILKSSLLCNCLWTRWTIYAMYAMWLAIIMIVLFLLTLIFALYLSRYKLSTTMVLNIMLISRVVFAAIFFFAFGIWAIFAPTTTIMEGANHGTKYFVLIALIFCFGIFLGWKGAQNIKIKSKIKKTEP